jgi:acyl carrier protein
MTNIDTIAKLDDYEGEDIFDVIVKLEKSFGLKFDKNAFFHIKTFGDLCDVFDNQINYELRDDCTKQQAFYRVREAIASTLQISRDNIQLDTKLSDLFPSRDRRQKAKVFKMAVGVDIYILTYPDWLALALVIGFLLSLAAFFYNWKIAWSGIVFFLSAIRIAEKLGKTLDVQTVRELTEKIAREHYVDIRRTKGTYNKQEILQIIIDTFSKELEIEKSLLTREATFGWTRKNATNSNLLKEDHEKQNAR